LSELANNKDLTIGKLAIFIRFYSIVSDAHYYLSQQVHPVVTRLCEPFNELDSARIAEALGLDPVGFRGHTAHRAVDLASPDMIIDLGRVLSGFRRKA
jgi:hypothetical protein